MTDENAEKRIKFEPVQKIEEQLLTGDVKTSYSKGSGVFHLDVGNTGLGIVFRKNDESIFGFMPERRSSHDPENARKHTTMLGYGLLNLYQWLGKNKLRVEEQYGFETKNFIISSKKTTTRLINALEGLFKRFGCENIIDTNREENEMLLDLNKLAKLDKNHPLIEYLEKWEERGKGIMVGGYTVEK